MCLCHSRHTKKGLAHIKTKPVLRKVAKGEKQILPIKMSMLVSGVKLSEKEAFPFLRKENFLCQRKFSSPNEISK